MQRRRCIRRKDWRPEPHTRKAERTNEGGTLRTYRGRWKGDEKVSIYNRGEGTTLGSSTCPFGIIIARHRCSLEHVGDEAREGENGHQQSRQDEATYGYKSPPRPKIVVHLCYKDGTHHASSTAHRCNDSHAHPLRGWAQHARVQGVHSNSCQGVPNSDKDTSAKELCQVQLRDVIAPRMFAPCGVPFVRVSPRKEAHKCTQQQGHRNRNQLPLPNLRQVRTSHMRGA